jgi:hypothetical protein
MLYLLRHPGCSSGAIPIHGYGVGAPPVNHDPCTCRVSCTHQGGIFVPCHGGQLVPVIPEDRANLQSEFIEANVCAVRLPAAAATHRSYEVYLLTLNPNTSLAWVTEMGWHRAGLLHGHVCEACVRFGVAVLAA